MHGATSLQSNLNFVSKTGFRLFILHVSHGVGRVLVRTYIQLTAVTYVCVFVLLLFRVLDAFDLLSLRLHVHRASCDLLAHRRAHRRFSVLLTNGDSCGRDKILDGACERRGSEP